MKAKNYLIVCRHAPYGESYAREALDVALAASAFGQSVSMLFLGAGVTQLLSAHDSAAIGEKSFEKQLSALPLYDIESIYVDSAALQQHGFQETDLSLPAQYIDAEGIASLFKCHDIVLNF